MSPATKSVVRNGLTLAALCLAPLALAEERSDPRPELETFARALDRSVRQVSRVGVGGFLGVTEACRGYHLKGHGAIFVLPPRALPSSASNAFVFLPGPPGFDVTGELRVEIHGEEVPSGVTDSSAPRAEAPAGRAESRPRKKDAPRRRVVVRNEELRALEEQVQALQREAERSRQEAERAMEQFMLEMRQQRHPGPHGISAPAPPTPPEPPSAPAVAAPPAPPAPWSFWFQTEEGGDSGAPERIMADVRSAVTTVLEEQRAPRLLRPEEFVSVAVDFLPRGSWIGSAPRPTKTLVVRVRKKEMEEHQAGKLTLEEFRKRIEYLEY